MCRIPLLQCLSNMMRIQKAFYLCHHLVTLFFLLNSVAQRKDFAQYVFRRIVILRNRNAQILTFLFSAQQDGARTSRCYVNTDFVRFRFYISTPDKTVSAFMRQVIPKQLQIIPILTVICDMQHELIFIVHCKCSVDPSVPARRKVLPYQVFTGQ